MSKSTKTPASKKEKFDAKSELERLNTKLDVTTAAYVDGIKSNIESIDAQRAELSEIKGEQANFDNRLVELNQKLEIAFDRLAQVESGGENHENRLRKLSNELESIDSRTIGIQHQIETNRKMHNQAQGNLPDDIRRVITEMPEFRWPSHIIQRGCVCPVGAEQGCRNLQCGRK